MYTYDSGNVEMKQTKIDTLETALVSAQGRAALAETERDEAVRLLREIVTPDLGKAGVWKRGYREAVHDDALALLARIKGDEDEKH